MSLTWSIQLKLGTVTQYNLRSILIISTVNGVGTVTLLLAIAVQHDFHRILNIGDLEDVFVKDFVANCLKKEKNREQLSRVGRLASEMMNTLAKSGFHNVRFGEHRIKMLFGGVKDSKENGIVKFRLVDEPFAKVESLIQKNIALVQVAHGTQFQQRAKRFGLR